MTEEYLLIAEWFDEEEGKWKPVLSKRPVIKTIGEKHEDILRRTIATGQ